jgi:hydroxylaminobenzene mutase
MNTATMLSRQGHRLLQLGVALFLFTSFEGFAIPYFTVPRLALSVHKLSALLGVLLPTMGLLWPRLKLGAATSRMAFWYLIYSALAIVAAYLMASIWGAGNSTIPLCSSCAREPVSGGGYYGRGLLVCADRHRFLRSHSLGSSRCGHSRLEKGEDAINVR